MYKIYADDILIYDDTSSDPYVKVASPNLTLEENAAGSLQMTIPPGNAGYDYIVRMLTDIKVEKDGRDYWFGRVIQESKDFWNNRNLTCEGELAFFNDTTQPQAAHEYTGQTCIRLYLQDLLDEHNSHVASNRQFTLGAVTVYASRIDIVTNYEKTIEDLNKLVDTYGGRFLIRRQNGVRYLDYLEEGLNNNSQTIEFAKNLIDFTSSYDSTEYATVVVPLGAKLEEKEIEGVENYLTVEDSSLGDGSIYVKSQDAINTYGWIEKVVHFDDETDSDNLYRLGQRYLSDIQFDTMVIELSAFDLHYLNSEIEDVKLGDRIRVISAPHGIDHFFPVKKLSIPLDQPQNSTYQLGDDIRTSLTSSNNKTNAELLEKLQESVAQEDAILDAAKANTEALMNMRLNGYITILEEDDASGTHSEGLYISGSIPLKNEDGTFAAEKFWKWTVSGLGYTDDYGQTWKAAMTMDGSILGERIAAGSIHGSKITAGSFALTTSTGQEAMTIGLKTRGMAPGSFVIGNINSDTGRNVQAASSEYARSIYKIYLTVGTVVKFTNTSYYFDPYEYSNNDSNESGYIQHHGSPVNRTFTVQTSNWYRFVVYKTNYAAITTNDLTVIAAAFELGGSTVQIRAEDLQIIGMVTLTDLAEEGSTVINGANIQTGSITANSIDLYSGFHVYDQVTGDETFGIDQDGRVTVNGTVSLSSSSVIVFDQGDDMTLGDLADEPVAKAIAGGTFANGTFISNNEIRSPTIRGGDVIGARFAASSSSGTTGSMLEYYDGRSSANNGLGRLIGLLGYDFQGSGSQQESEERLILSTQWSIALKLMSGAGLSLEARDYIYLESLTRLDRGLATARGYGFGTQSERLAISSPVVGQLFFQID